MQTIKIHCIKLRWMCIEIMSRMGDANGNYENLIQIIQNYIYSRFQCSNVWRYVVVVCTWSADLRKNPSNIITKFKIISGNSIRHQRRYVFYLVIRTHIATQTLFSGMLSGNFGALVSLFRLLHIWPTVGMHSFLERMHMHRKKSRWNL